jgi:hypothetical protein
VTYKQVGRKKKENTERKAKGEREIAVHVLEKHAVTKDLQREELPTYTHSQ